MTAIQVHPRAPLPAQHDLPPRIWGLEPRALHDAYWRGLGVQSLRCGAMDTVDRNADFYVLVEADQFVLFDLRSLAERLVWRQAAVTRIRVVDREPDEYGEEVVLDDDGHVERIGRRYTPHERSTYRVLVTSRRRIAQMWSEASDWRSAWTRIRRVVRWSEVDHWKCAGGCYHEGEPAQMRAMVDRLVTEWTDPDRAIEGIELIAPGVWGLADSAPVPSDCVLVGPAWCGHGALMTDSCVIGPTVLGDIESPDHPARPRLLREIELPEKPAEPEPEIVEPRPGYAFAKRAFDVLFSALVLLGLLPAFIVVALAIMIEDGRPILFGHVRQTCGGRLFKCWKFRSMYRDAESRVTDLQTDNLCDGPQVNIAHDPRITRIGNLLRRFHVDELPQFWNVLIGDMSVVGPRPSPENENQMCPAWRDIRLSVRPGVTGLWQLSRTREPGKDFQEWIQYDIEYVRQAGFWYDLMLVLRTAGRMLVGRR